VGNEHTFDGDIGDMDRVYEMLLYLSQKVGRRLRKHGFAGRTVTLKLRYADFETHTRRETFPGLVWDDIDICQAGKMLLLQLYTPGRKIRLIGVSLSGLVRTGSHSAQPLHQIDLFSRQGGSRAVLPAIDGLRDKFGERIISRAGAQR